MKIIGLAGSTSSTSINKQLVHYSLSLFEGCKTELLDLNDYEVAIYSSDKENASGIPTKIQELASKISEADMLVLSLAEHNGSYTAAFKNTYDWMSRIPNRKTFDGKGLLLMATSPGGRGGISVLTAAKDRFPRDGAEMWGTFSLPSFFDNFNSNKGELSNIQLQLELKRLINKIRHEQLGLSDVDTSNCGINRSENDCGDASDH